MTITSNFSLNLSNNKSFDFNDWHQFFYLLLELIRTNQPLNPLTQKAKDLEGEILRERTYIDYLNEVNLDTFATEEETDLECLIRFFPAYTDPFNEDGNQAGHIRNLSTYKRAFEVMVLMPSTTTKAYHSSYALKLVTKRLLESILHNDTPTNIRITVPSGVEYGYEPRQSIQLGSTLFPQAKDGEQTPGYSYSMFRVLLPITKIS